MRNPANKRTDVNENITSLAEVIIFDKLTPVLSRLQTVDTIPLEVQQKYFSTCPTANLIKQLPVIFRAIS